MTKKVKRIGKWLLAILLAPFALVLLLALLLYIPPIQNFVVDRVAESLSKSLQMQIRVDNVRLAFPLDLHIFLGFQRLMETVAVTAAEHETDRKSVV